MPQNPNQNWGVPMNMHDTQGHQIFNSDGTPAKGTAHMADTLFLDRPQSLYFPNNHPNYPGWFKGMAAILEEQGYSTKGM